ncbi:hypothetical protein V497_02333 [Pseudogymnoascus sp. VKM F-4516 (FW-969)]|nr:hypothetical protein V497_02333 [Pseudogymnoascus sp. VKM F-4516 (FW-969)]
MPSAVDIRITESPTPPPAKSAHHPAPPPIKASSPPTSRPRTAGIQNATGPGSRYTNAAPPRLSQLARVGIDARIQGLEGECGGGRWCNGEERCGCRCVCRRAEDEWESAEEGKEDGWRWKAHGGDFEGGMSLYGSWGLERGDTLLRLEAQSNSEKILNSDEEAS